VLYWPWEAVPWEWDQISVSRSDYTACSCSDIIAGGSVRIPAAFVAITLSNLQKVASPTSMS
jgi:hypothetical protein